MRCLDISHLIDYFRPDRDGHAAAVSYVKDHYGESFFVPPHVAYELSQYAIETKGPEGLSQLSKDLAWTKSLAFGSEEATEAARINAELHGSGTPINEMDVLIAGTVRAAGGTLVTRDRDYERVDGLDVDRY
ncbi:PIN domain-containing protein [Halegenticoccus soli]|uniref:PIN domain-containing protein n=1 Tax=Halegenticoccus soli TaxID=1985678 RepID=UPI000C6EFD88|nr:PIN domain-containing protein [Halegenticoccus soli]